MTKYPKELIEEIMEFFGCTEEQAVASFRYRVFGIGQDPLQDPLHQQCTGCGDMLTDDHECLRNR